MLLLLSDALLPSENKDEIRFPDFSMVGQAKQEPGRLIGRGSELKIQLEILLLSGAICGWP